MIFVAGSGPILSVAGMARVLLTTESTEQIRNPMTEPNDRGNTGHAGRGFFITCSETQKRFTYFSQNRYFSQDEQAFLEFPNKVNIFGLVCFFGL